MRSLGYLVLTIVLPLWSGFCASFLWRWFVEPWSHVSLGWLTLAGMHLTWGCFLGGAGRSDKAILVDLDMTEDEDNRVFWIRVFYGAFVPPMLLGAGWIIRVLGG
jgi:hypothetical protein